MPSDHEFKIMGKKIPWRYTRLRGSSDGWAYMKDPKNQDIRERVIINEALKGRPLMETEIHEYLHLAVGHLASEEWVTQAAADLARIMHAVGYRKVK